MDCTRVVANTRRIKNKKKRLDAIRRRKNKKLLDAIMKFAFDNDAVCCYRGAILALRFGDRHFRASNGEPVDTHTHTHSLALAMAAVLSESCKYIAIINVLLSRFRLRAQCKRAAIAIFAHPIRNQLGAKLRSLSLSRSALTLQF